MQMVRTKKYNTQSPFIQSIVDASLSPVSKKIYLERLRKLMQTMEKDMFTLITKPKATIAWIKDTYPSMQTQKSYISAVLAVFRHNDGLKTQEKAAYDEWYALFQTVHKEIDERYRRNEPTERQKEAYVPFDEIVHARDELKKGSPERLLFSMYTYIPPLRCDFNKLRIYRNVVPSQAEKNYLLLKGADSKLVLTEFKTEKKAQGYEKMLGEALLNEIEASLEQDPRSWLFMDKNGQPYSAKSYTQWANRVFAKVLKKPMTVSLIRHAYINSLDFNTLTVAQKEEIAKDMAHTVGTQDRYRLIFDRSEKA